MVSIRVGKNNNAKIDVIEFEKDRVNENRIEKTSCDNETINVWLI
jgi:hypothetical protein